MKRIENSRILFLDEMPIRRLLEFRSDYYPIMLQILDVVYERKIQMIASPVTLVDLAGRAYEKNLAVLARELKEFFTNSAQFRLRELDAEIAILAAEYRVKYKFTLEESVQFATAYVAGADLVLSENEKAKEIDGLNVLLLSEIQND